VHLNFVGGKWFLGGLGLDRAHFFV
jgi:hypothetical protein